MVVGWEVYDVSMGLEDRGRERLLKWHMGSVTIDQQQKE